MMRAHGLVSPLEAAEILTEYISDLESGKMDTRYGPRPDLDAQRTEEAGRILREKFKEVSMGKAFDELNPRVTGCENTCNDVLNRLARVEARLTEIEELGEYLAPAIPKGRIVEIAGPPAKTDLLAKLCAVIGLKYNVSEEVALDAVREFYRRAWTTGIPAAEPKAQAMSDLHARLCEILELRYNNSEEAIISTVQLLQQRTNSDLFNKLCNLLGLKYFGPDLTELNIIDSIKLLNRRIDDMTASRDIVSKERDKLLAENKKLNERIDGIGAILASAYDEDNFAQGGT